MSKGRARIAMTGTRGLRVGLCVVVLLLLVHAERAARHYTQGAVRAHSAACVRESHVRPPAAPPPSVAHAQTLRRTGPPATARRSSGAPASLEPHSRRSSGPVVSGETPLGRDLGQPAGVGRHAGRQPETSRPGGQQTGASVSLVYLSWPGFLALGGAKSGRPSSQNNKLRPQASWPARKLAPVSRRSRAQQPHTADRLQFQASFTIASAAEFGLPLARSLARPVAV